VKSIVGDVSQAESLDPLETETPDDGSTIRSVMQEGPTGTVRLSKTPGPLDPVVSNSPAEPSDPGDLEPSPSTFLGNVDSSELPLETDAVGPSDFHPDTSDAGPSNQDPGIPNMVEDASAPPENPRKRPPISAARGDPRGSDAKPELPRPDLAHHATSEETLKASSDPTYRPDSSLTASHLARLGMQQQAGPQAYERAEGTPFKQDPQSVSKTPAELQTTRPRHSKDSPSKPQYTRRASKESHGSKGSRTFPSQHQAGATSDAINLRDSSGGSARASCCEKGTETA